MGTGESGAAEESDEGVGLGGGVGAGLGGVVGRMELGGGDGRLEGVERRQLAGILVAQEVGLGCRRRTRGLVFGSDVLDRRTGESGVGGELGRDLGEVLGLGARIGERRLILRRIGRRGIHPRGARRRRIACGGVLAHRLILRGGPMGTDGALGLRHVAGSI